jgi:signal transduction histidine kinase
VLGAPALDILPGWPELADALGSDQTARVQATLQRDGASIHLEVRVSPLYQEAAGLGGWLAVLRDVTDRVHARQAERQQRALAESLRSSLAVLASTLSLDEVLDRIMEQAATVAPHQASNIVLIREGQAYVARAHGYGQFGLEDFINEMQLPVMETANLRWMVETRQPLAISDTQQYAGWVKLRGVEWASSYAGAPIISRGEVIGFLNLDDPQPGRFDQSHAQALQAFADQAAIAIENARLYASLQEANEKLSRALQAREEAIQNVSHELRTPLTLMMGYVELMESGETGPVTGEQVEVLRIVAQHGRRLQFIFNRLLTLQNFHQEELRLQQVDLVTWLYAAVGAWRHQAAGTGVTVQMKIPGDLPPVLVAPSYLELVIGNLLDNALKFSPLDSTIVVSSRVEEDSVVIAVADQGAGIPQDQLDLIFGRFYQIDGSRTRRYGGMGIGLALCRAIVAAHGGSIWAESPGPEQGSTFYIRLPVAPPEGQEGT